MKRAWLLLATAALAMGGCGQKGPLYLPDKNAKVMTSPAAPAVAPATAPAQTPATKSKSNGQDQDSQPQPQPPPK